MDEESALSSGLIVRKLLCAGREARALLLSRIKKKRPELQSRSSRGDFLLDKGSLLPVSSSPQVHTLLLGMEVNFTRNHTSSVTSQGTGNVKH